jgi:hypothetical protein
MARRPSYPTAFKESSCMARQGSSFDAPSVAAMAARLWLDAPALRRDVDATLQILKQSSELQFTSSLPCSPGSAIPNKDFGYGEIKLPTAVAMGRTATPRPTRTQTPKGGP